MLQKPATTPQQGQTTTQTQTAPQQKLALDSTMAGPMTFTQDAFQGPPVLRDYTGHQVSSELARLWLAMHPLVH